MNETQVYRGNERLGLLDSGDEIGNVVGGRGPSSVPSHTKQAAARLVDGGVLTPEKAERIPSLLFIHPRASLLIFLARRRQYPGMIWSLLCSLLSAFKTRRSLALENLALRQQLAVQKRSVKRPRLSNVDRGFWVLLRRFWTDWARVLIIVKPETVVRWHRSGFKRYWTWKSRRRRPGRPGVAPELRELIRDMCRANPLWGAPRVHGELAKLGISISQAALSKYKIRHRRPPSQTWRSVLDNHVKDLVSVDFFTLPTATFRILFVFIVLRHDRRRILHFNVTEHPTAEWSAQQIVDTFPWDSAPRFICCGTGMESTGRTSNVASRDSASNRFLRRRARHGRARTSNESLEAFAASASTT